MGRMAKIIPQGVDSRAHHETSIGALALHFAPPHGRRTHYADGA